MKNKSSVYIILLNYNNYSDTIECFESLQNITYQNYNIVIIDNNSLNNSMHYLKEYLDGNKQKYIYYNLKKEAVLPSTKNKFTTLIQSGHNGGYGYGNNIGIKYALNNNADYILILNNDTVVDKRFLEPLVETCENDDKIGIVSGKIYFYDKPNTIWFNGGKFHPCTTKVEHVNFNEKDIGQKPLVDNTFISGCVWLIPKKVFKTIGFINEEYFMYVEDLEFTQRVLQAGYTLNVSEQSHIWHKVYARSGGHLSEYPVYYIARNTLKYILSRSNGICKLTGIFYLFFVSSLRLIYWKRFDLLKDHLKGILHGIKQLQKT